MATYEILDPRLTEDDCREISYYGERNGYTYKDYMYISEIRDSDGNLAAKIHNNASIYIDDDDEDL